MIRGEDIISPEMQLAAAQEYARQFGDDDLVVLTDLNKSGRKGRKDRPGFDQLLSAIEAGQVKAVYSYSLSRLSRSVRDIMSLADLCREHQVPIRLARDTDPDPTTATGRAVLALLGVMAQLEADLASERALDAVEARRARGDTFGPPQYEDDGTTVEAYRQAGSFTGAARLLTERGVPAPRGRGIWFPSTVRTIVQRDAPHLLPLPAHRARGAKGQAPFLFHRLLRCHCGTTLTGVVTNPPYRGYRCERGRLDPLHGQTFVSERIVLAWAEKEAARLRPPRDLVARGESNDAERVALLERLDRIRVAFVNGLYRDESEMLAEKAEVEAGLMRLDLQGRAASVPAVRWDREAAVVNRTLRSLWAHVQLDGDLRPVHADWMLPPEWVAPPPAPTAPGSLAALPG